MDEEIDKEGTDLGALATAEWIVRQAIRNATPSDLVRGLCALLRDRGLPVGRLQVAFRILHPLFGAVTVTWDEDNDIRVELREDSRAPISEFAASPFFAMLQAELKRLRYRLDDAAVLDRFPLLGSLARRRYTDYFAVAVPFNDTPLDGSTTTGILMSFASRRASGFSDQHLEELEWLCGPLALALKSDINQEIAANALRTFHGAAVGERILGGMIKRGAGERIRTVVWYSDLRNSTSLGETLDLDSFLALLNSYFECSAGAVLEHGGQVLELIGDAVLGIFPIEGTVTAADACSLAFAAARTARQRLAQLVLSNAGSVPFEFGIGLNFGKVIFGNVGTVDRLSFGLVGGAVNEAARMESMTKLVRRPVVVSDSLAEIASEPLEDLGFHRLRGVETPRHLWALLTPR